MKTRRVKTKWDEERCAADKLTFFSSAFLTVTAPSSSFNCNFRPLFTRALDKENFLRWAESERAFWVHFAAAGHYFGSGTARTSLVCKFVSRCICRHECTARAQGLCECFSFRYCSAAKWLETKTVCAARARKQITPRCAHKTHTLFLCVLARHYFAALVDVFCFSHSFTAAGLICACCDFLPRHGYRFLSRSPLH